MYDQHIIGKYVKKKKIWRQFARKAGIVYCLHSEELLGSRQEFDSPPTKGRAQPGDLYEPSHTKVKNLGLAFKTVQSQHENSHILLIYNFGNILWKLEKCSYLFKKWYLGANRTLNGQIWSNLSDKINRRSLDWIALGL